ncbi:aldo/keto reductase [uncultured Friedmanniella sp.]|uniref:aldo/keto reductase n=1 Tax=uncultured Friedmanniella sp. TaxID=335381 RepID=UPI0035CC14BA
MQYARLGSTDLTVSQLAFGTAPLGGLFGRVEESDAIALVHEALDLGITFLDTSPFYGSAEERLGSALVGRRDEVVLATKAGRYGPSDFDFTPARLRRSVEQSLRLLKTDHLDILQLHDIEFVPLGPVFEDAHAELVAIRDEGLCRYIGMTGYPLATMTRAMREAGLDVLLTYAHATLLDDSLQRELAPVAAEQGVGLINAAAVALGLLTPHGTSMGADHPAGEPVRQAARAMADLAAQRDVDLAFVANQYSVQRSGCATTLIGTGRSQHLRSAVDAAETPLDDELVDTLVALRPAPAERVWTSGLPENN